MDGTLKRLLLFAFVVHLAAVLFIFYARVYPFGGGEGDQLFYHRAATQISENFRQGDFSWAHIKEELAKESMDQSYPVFIAVFYAITVQDKLVGQLVSLGFFLFSLIALYFVMKELGIAETWRFRIGIVASLYPSYLYFSSMLLKESMIAFLFLLSLLFVLKLMKSFSWKLLIPLFIVLFLLFHFRFYVGAVALGGVIFAFLFSQNLVLKKKIAYGLIFLLIVGFIPLFAGKGYFGVSEVRSFLQPSRLADYGQRVGDAPSPHTSLFSLSEAFKNPLLFIRSVFPQDSAKNITPSGNREAASTIKRDSESGALALLKTLPQSFLRVAFGPFPWEMKYVQQLFALLETIPWLVFSFLILKGAFKSRAQWRTLLPVLLFGVFLLLAIAAFTNNYGTYMRIRIPAFLVLFTLIPFVFSYGAHRNPDIT